MCASNSDITDILADGTLKIGGRDMDALSDFLAKVRNLGDATETRFVFTVSTDKEELPASVFDNCEIL